MSSLNLKRSLILVSMMCVLILVFVGLGTPTTALARSIAPVSTSTPKPTEPPPPTPEFGSRGCAISKLVGYHMDDDSYQFYYVGENGQGTKVGGVPSATMKSLLSSPAGKTLSLKGPNGDSLTLTSLGDGAFETAYKDSTTTCS